MATKLLSIVLNSAFQLNWILNLKQNTSFKSNCISLDILTDIILRGTTLRQCLMLKIEYEIVCYVLIVVSEKTKLFWSVKFACSSIELPVYALCMKNKGNLA